MDIGWQYNNPPNPANATIGAAGYDNHLYYSFGVSYVHVADHTMLTTAQGVADANANAYLASICRKSYWFASGVTCI